MNVVTLFIIIMIGMVVGVSLLPNIGTSIAALDSTVLGASVVNLAKLLPLIFVAIIMVVAVRFIGRSSA